MSKVLAYYRLTKPGIIRGNVLTAAAGFLFAANWDIDSVLLVATLAGTSLVIASACVFNNYIDRHIDAKMARTKKRGIVTGEISTSAALIFATILSLVGFSALLLWVNIRVALIGLAALAAYVVLYGIAKRRTTFGTLVGSIPGAASIAAGYVAVTDSYNSTAALLFLIMVVWQMPHFYAIAIYRLDDYKAAGLPVLPLVKGVRSTKIRIVAYIAAYALATSALWASGHASTSFAVVMGLCSGWWLISALRSFDTLDNTKWAQKMFGISLVVLLALSIMLPLSTLLP